MMPSRPDFEGLQPIEENFIPEPQIWAVSLALLPATIFAPFFFGPPLTLPYGFVYWALDYKPNPNWLNSTPPMDWLDKLLKGGNSETTTYNPSSPNENCRADLGLPSPGANSITLNDYYANQNPLPRDPTIPDLTGQSGTAQTVDSQATQPPAPGSGPDLSGLEEVVDSSLEELGDDNSKLEIEDFKGDWGTIGGPSGLEGVERANQGTTTPGEGIIIPDFDPYSGNGSNGGDPF
jgi:hypothetical protein